MHRQQRENKKAIHNEALQASIRSAMWVLLSTLCLLLFSSVSVADATGDRDMENKAIAAAKETGGLYWYAEGHREAAQKQLDEVNSQIYEQQIKKAKAEASLPGLEAALADAAAEAEAEAKAALAAAQKEIADATAKLQELEKQKEKLEKEVEKWEQQKDEAVKALGKEPEKPSGGSSGGGGEEKPQQPPEKKEEKKEEKKDDGGEDEKPEDPGGKVSLKKDEEKKEKPEDDKTLDQLAKLLGDKDDEDSGGSKATGPSHGDKMAEIVRIGALGKAAVLNEATNGLTGEGDGQGSADPNADQLVSNDPLDAIRQAIQEADANTSINGNVDGETAVASTGSFGGSSGGAPSAGDFGGDRADGHNTGHGIAPSEPAAFNQKFATNIESAKAGAAIARSFSRGFGSYSPTLSATPLPPYWEMDLMGIGINSKKRIERGSTEKNKHRAKNLKR